MTTNISSDRSIPPVGFSNINSICYFNALIQCLLSSHFFRSYAIDSGNLLINDFFNNLNQGKWDNFFTTRFLESMPGENKSNQSSSEYFLQLIEKLKMDKLFEYHHLAKRTCQVCGSISEDMDKTTNLLLNNNIMELFEYSEIINDVICNKCKQRVDMKQERNLRSVSPVMVISLNKYFEKTKFYYPPYFKIDIPSGRVSEHRKTPEDTNTLEYTLIATLDHFGGLGGGHYVARVLRDGVFSAQGVAEGKNSFVINDSIVSLIGGKELECVYNSYMLFYERKIEN